MKALFINILYFSAATISYAAPNSLSTPGEADAYKYVLGLKGSEPF
jgi:hypothetical protein